MAQATSNLTPNTNPYSFGNLLKPMPVSTKPTIGAKPKVPALVGVPTGANKNMNSVAGTPTAPYAVTQSKPATAQAPAPANTAPPAINATAQPQQQQNITTPSGIPVTGNPATWAGVPQQQTYQPNDPTSGVRGLFPNVITSIADRGTYVDPVTQKAVERAQELTTQLRQSRQNQAVGESQQRLAPIPIGDATGRQMALRQLYEQQQTALSGELAGQAELAGIGQTQQTIQQSALGTAAGYAQPSQNFPFVFDPLTQTYKSAPGLGGGGSNLDPQTQAQTLAQEVVSGRRTLGDALGAMSHVGSSAQTFLNNAIRNIDPNFNFSQAEALGLTQGTIGPSYRIAEDALTKVETALNSLPAYARTNIPLVSTHGAGIAAQLGINATQLQQYGASVQTLKNAYANLLASVRGGTPSAYTEQVNVEVPDWPTPAQLEAVRNNMQTLGKSRVEIFSSPGSVGAFDGSKSSGGTGWDF